MKKHVRFVQVFILLILTFFAVSINFAQEQTITLCHATGIATSPYELMTVTYTTTNGHEAHAGDIIPAPLLGCPSVTVTAEATSEATAEVTAEVTAEATAEATSEATAEVTAEATLEVTAEATDEAGSIGGRVTICHATGSAANPYNEISISVNGLNGHEGHNNDIIPAPEAGCNPATQATATAAAVDLCPSIVDDGSFPNLDVNNCAPDTSVVERAMWEPITLAAVVCPTWLVYHSNQTGNWELFRLDTMPNDAPMNLSRGLGSSAMSPSRSPDAQWITFMSNRDGNWEIYIAAVEGDLVQRLSYNTTAIERDPVWSPTGGQIVYESNRDGDWDLYLYDTNSGTEERITSADGNDVNASWSADGTKILFQSDRDGMWQIYEKTISSNDERLLSDTNGNDIAPQYIYNGTSIVFRSFRDGGNSVLYWMNADGSDVRPISDGAGYALNHAVAPQGTFVAYTSNLDGDNDIYVYEFATGLTRQVTNNSVNDYAATWNCSGTSITFNSDVTGNPELFSTDVLAMDAPAIVVEEQANQLTNMTSQELYPMMSPAEENASRTEGIPAVQN